MRRTSQGGFINGQQALRGSPLKQSTVVWNKSRSTSFSISLAVLLQLHRSAHDGDAARDELTSGPFASRPNMHRETKDLLSSTHSLIYHLHLRIEKDCSNLLGKYPITPSHTFLASVKFEGQCQQQATSSAHHRNWELLKR